MKSKRTTRNFSHLSLEERLRIEIRYRDGLSLRAIAREIGRPTSAVSREVGGRPRRSRGTYRARPAQERALKRRLGKRDKRLKNETIREYAVEKLKLGWSPEQITLRLPLDHPGEAISHEAVYQYVYAQVCREGYGPMKPKKEDLRPFLPRRHKRRRKKGLRKARKLERQERLPSIEQRPKRVERRKEVGHWEDDCIVSKQSKVRLKTVNERSTGIVFIEKMTDGSIEESNAAVERRLSGIPAEWRKTLTRGRWSENLGYRTLETVLDLSCYFANPYCSHERGSNENLNGLVRRFVPKKTDLATLTEEEIRRMERLINSRPRKRFGGKTPYEVFYAKTGVALDC